MQRARHSERGGISEEWRARPAYAAPARPPFLPEDILARRSDERVFAGCRGGGPGEASIEISFGEGGADRVCAADPHCLASPQPVQHVEAELGIKPEGETLTSDTCKEGDASAPQAPEEAEAEVPLIARVGPDSPVTEESEYGLVRAPGSEASRCGSPAPSFAETEFSVY